MLSKLSFEKVLIALSIVAILSGLVGYPATIAVLGLMALDGFKFITAQNKDKNEIKTQIAELAAKTDKIEKSLTDRMSTVDNKLAGLGIARR
jgi:cell division protein FtsL